jgi:hypothetical protein
LVERDGASGADAPESLEIDKSISRAAGMKKKRARTLFPRASSASPDLRAARFERLLASGGSAPAAPAFTQSSLPKVGRIS